ncbi:VOC family protein, partial [Pseudomonas sp. GW460-5]
MRPFTIKHIDHLVLRVSDLPRSVAFYTGLLGCHVSRVREDLGMVHLATGTAMIDLVTLDGPLGRPG